MKAVILAGGLGTRLSEETNVRPKPLVEIGGRPLLWHIMKTYSFHGVNEFVICCGYKGYMIKEYFANYFLHVSDVTFDIAENRMEVHRERAEPWRVTLVDTGDETLTGGRLRRISEYVAGDEAFCMTYGDGLADIDVTALIGFHRAHGRKATVTAVKPPGRFGAVEVEGDRVSGFTEQRPGAGRLLEEVAPGESRDGESRNVGAGAAEGAVDAANMLKPSLSRGELQCIGATTLDEFRENIE